MDGGRAVLCLAVVGAVAGCRKAPVLEPITVPPPTAEAISFLGDTLWSVPLDLDRARARLERLQQSRQRLAARPNDVNAHLSVARRTASMGRLRESITLLNEAITRHVDDARLFRLRGDVLVATRRLGEALRDFQHAARLAMGDSTTVEYLEVDDLGIIGFGLRQSILLALGQTFYLRGDYRSAVRVLDEALAAARNADEAAGAAVWLVIARSRADEDLTAAVMIAERWPRDAAVVLRAPEHSLLLAWNGALSLDSLRVLGRDDPDGQSLYAYAMAVMQLRSGDTTAATAWLEMVRGIGNWTALPYIAAEVDLRRLRDAAARTPSGT